MLNKDILIVKWYYPESTELFIEDQAFSQLYDLAPPPLSRQQVVFPSQYSCVSPVELTDGGMGEPNKTTARKPGPL
jgi:hypothetical protein